MNKLQKLAPYAKSAAAFLVGLASFLVVLSTAIADGTVTTDEVITVCTSLAAWLGGTATVFQIPNKKVGK